MTFKRNPFYKSVTHHHLYFIQYTIQKNDYQSEKKLTHFHLSTPASKQSPKNRVILEEQKPDCQTQARLNFRESLSLLTKQIAPRQIPSRDAQPITSPGPSKSRPRAHRAADVRGEAPRINRAGRFENSAPRKAALARIFLSRVRRTYNAPSA